MTTGCEDAQSDGAPVISMMNDIEELGWAKEGMSSTKTCTQAWEARELYL